MWFSPAIRSGAWTYHEATPRTRQQAMITTLAAEAQAGYAAAYSFGMETLRDDAKRHAVDTSIGRHEQDCSQWLWRLANQHGAIFERACGQTNPAAP